MAVIKAIETGTIHGESEQREKFIGAEFIRVDPIRDESKRSEWGDCEDVHFVDVVTSLGPDVLVQR